MTTSPRYGINLPVEGQASGEVTVGEFLLFLEALKNGKVIDRDLNTPPGSPTNGDLYIGGPAPTGAWSGQALKCRYYWNGCRAFTVQDRDIVRIAHERAHYGDSASERPGSARRPRRAAGGCRQVEHGGGG